MGVQMTWHKYGSKPIGAGFLLPCGKYLYLLSHSASPQVLT